MVNPETKNSAHEQIKKEDDFEEVFANLSEDELRKYLSGADQGIIDAEENAKKRILEATETGNFYIERSKKIKKALEKLLANKKSA